MKPVLNINIEYISNKCEVRSEEIKPVLNIPTNCLVQSKEMKPVLNINIELISTNC